MSGKYVVIRTGFLSTIWAKRDIWALLFFFVLTLGFGVLYLCLGERLFSPIKLFDTLMGNGSKIDDLLIFSLRMPRLMGAFLVGAGLAMSGFIIQTLIKNPLSSPSILGVNEAAFVGMLIFMVLFFDGVRFAFSLSMHYMPLFSVLGAFVLLWLLYVLGLNQSLSPFKIILIGLGLASIFEGLSYILIVQGPMMFQAEIHNWINGTVHSVRVEELVALSIYLGLSLLFIIGNKNRFDVSHLSDSSIISLGIPLRMCKALFLGVAVGIAGVCVAVAGSLSFVGLLAPHIAKKIVSIELKSALPMTMMIGGNLALLADLIGRYAFRPLDLPMGIFIALFGAPFFIMLLMRSKA